jgi:integration host factor subunit beta
VTRSDLVIQLAERFGQLTHRDTEFAVKTILDAMASALARGHRIEIRGFGSFSINRRPPRVGRNPRSGEQVVISEKLVPHFKPGKALREAVDQRVGALRAAAEAEGAGTGAASPARPRASIGGRCARSSGSSGPPSSSRCSRSR